MAIKKIMLNKKIKMKIENAESATPPWRNRASNKKGFALTLALLIVSIVTSIGLSIFEILFTEASLTRNINESQYAFYSADTGAECVLYWDLKKTPPLSIAASKTITCNNETKTIGGALSSGFQLLFDNGTCANVTVNINGATGQRTIESLGRSKYDTTTNNCNTSLPKRSERGIELNYF